MKSLMEISEFLIFSFISKDNSSKKANEAILLNRNNAFLKFSSLGFSKYANKKSNILDPEPDAGIKKQVDFLAEVKIVENSAISSGKKREIPSLILQAATSFTKGFEESIKRLCCSILKSWGIFI